jgi:hypothetical protein
VSLHGCCTGTVVDSPLTRHEAVLLVAVHSIFSLFLGLLAELLRSRDVLGSPHGEWIDAFRQVEAPFTPKL